MNIHFCMRWIFNEVWHVEPLGEASVGPIIFEPFQHAQCPCKTSRSLRAYKARENWRHKLRKKIISMPGRYRTTLYVRNNLTALHQVELIGHGGSSRLVFPEGVLAPRRPIVVTDGIMSFECISGFPAASVLTNALTHFECPCCICSSD